MTALGHTALVADDPIRVLVVDDEPLARERVSTLVRETEGLELVGEGANGLDALDLITALEPDVVFIDIEMPELDGFGVVAALDVGHVPQVLKGLFGMVHRDATLERA